MPETLDPGTDSREPRAREPPPVRDHGDMTDLLYVDGGTPLHGEITVRGAKNFVSKAMVASLLGETPSELRNVPQIRDVAVVTGLLELHGVAVRADAKAGTLHLDSSARASARRGHRRARGLEPNPHPLLRAAPAPARRGVHPGPGRLPHRRPAHQLPPRHPAPVRRRR